MTADRDLSESFLGLEEEFRPSSCRALRKARPLEEGEHNSKTSTAAAQERWSCDNEF